MGIENSTGGRRDNLVMVGWKGGGQQRWDGWLDRGGLYDLGLDTATNSRPERLRLLLYRDTDLRYTVPK